MDTVSTADGRQLNIERRGEGRPTVVFESGMGMSRSTWGAVVPAVAAETATVVYDRSGLGRSAPDPAPRVLARLAADHVDLLTALDAGPYVLVAHSWGGPIVRSVAALVPDRIAGLVLVDQSDEGCELFFSTAAERQFRMMSYVLPVLARVGVMRLIVGRTTSALPEPEASAMRAEDSTVAAARAQLAEMASTTDDLRRLLAEPPVPPDVPVTLISGTKATRVGRHRRDALVAAHRARAESLPQGRHVLADGSGHLVPLTEPAIVADEVLRIVRAVRG
jgi:pimeloyl-ACP methyl ester carboxylesterase